VKSNKFNLPPIDEVKTREAVEAELEKALFYKLTDIDREEQKLTSAYGDAVSESQRSNVTTDPTARIATNNVSKEEERNAHIFRVEKAVSRLAKRQRDLITARYLTSFDVKDVDVYLGTVPMSWVLYRRLRAEAFYMLAFTLKVYVEKETTHAENT
jgi:ArpU family phage transcriptional regulator